MIEKISRGGAVLPNGRQAGNLLAIRKFISFYFVSMYKIYALFYKDLDRVYVGMTKDLTRRIAEHKRGKNISTKNRGSFSVCLIEKCRNVNEARVREKYWKSGYGKERLKKYYRGVEQSGSSAGS